MISGEEDWEGEEQCQLLLPHRWSAYVSVNRDAGLKYDRRKSWLDDIEKVYEFEKITDFWCFFHNSVCPSWFPGDVDSLRVFKASSSLEQTDPDNIFGGRLVYFSATSDPDAEWLKLLLCCLSDEHADLYKWVNGTVAKCLDGNGTSQSQQRKLRFEVWLKSGVPDIDIIDIKSMMKRVLQLESNSKILYKPHLTS